MKLTALIFTTVTLVAVSIVIGAVVYDRLPAAVPTHFDLHGRPDGFTAKPLGVFAMPAVLALLGLVFVALPRISPKGYRIDPFLRTYEIIAIAVLAMGFADGMMGLWLALGYRFDARRLAVASMGLLLIILGNFLGKVTRNFFVGIRTPWTLASPEVWLRTHRIGGVLFVIGGAVILVGGFVSAAGAAYLLVTVIAAIALFLTIYSYVLYRQIENGSAEDEV